VTGPGLQYLVGAAGTLESLDISETLIGNSGLPFIAPFTNLKTLSLWNGSFDAEGMKALVGLTKIVDLDLEGCRGATADGLKHLSGMTGLEKLNLNETGANDSVADVLVGFKSLKSVSIGRTEISEAAEAKLKGAIPGIVVTR
jgi:hypothetical protein